MPHCFYTYLPYHGLSPNRITRGILDLHVEGRLKAYENTPWKPAAWTKGEVVVGGARAGKKAGVGEPGRDLPCGSKAVKKASQIGAGWVVPSNLRNPAIFGDPGFFGLKLKTSGTRGCRRPPFRILGPPQARAVARRIPPDSAPPPPDQPPATSLGPWPNAR